MRILGYGGTTSFIARCIVWLMEPLRLSPSRMNDFTNCPQLYKYRAVDQLPEPPSIDAERGKLIHAVLEDLFELPASSRTMASATELLPRKWSEQLWLFQN